MHLAFLAASALLKLWLSISKSIQIRKKKKRRNINLLCRWRISLRLFLTKQGSTGAYYCHRSHCSAALSVKWEERSRPAELHGANTWAVQRLCTELQVCSVSAQALQGGSLNGLKPSLCSLNPRQLQSLQFPLAQFVQLTAFSQCCESSLVFSPTQSYCYPGKLLAVPFISSAMGNFSLSVQLLFVSRCPFCSAWWMRYGTCKEMPAFGRGLPYNFIGLFLRNGQRKISVVAGKSCSIPRF